MEVRYKVWLEKDGEVVAGNGKVGLLKLVDELGSIQKAAEKYGMSYRHAWGVLQKMEKRAGLKLVETQVGGKEGGGTQLTPQARKFLGEYEVFRKGLDQSIVNKFEKAFKK
jgi:molybdate transport system regulatory protein